VLDGLNRYLSQMTAAVQSGCQGEVPEDVFKGCYGIKQRLDAELSQLYPRMDAAERERQALDAEAADLRPRLDRAIANAEYLLGRDNTEEALRLFISWAVDLDRAPYTVSVQSCQTFSLIATALGNRVANQKLFVDLLVRNVVERSHVGVILMQLKGRPPLREVLNWEAYLSRSTRTFNATGFRREFYDFSLAENQVRHAAGYMLGGYEFSQKPTELYSYLTDRIIPRVKLGPAQEADFRLAVAAAQIGFQLQSGRLRTTDVGGAIMSRLCQ